MIDPANVPPIASHERVTRFATASGQFRADGTVKQDLFIPTSAGETSVMRLLNASDAEVWRIGNAVAVKTNRTLYGRSDLGAHDCVAVGLQVASTPLPTNPNHADITKWPGEKSDQKSVAQKLAARADKLIRRE